MAFRSNGPIQLALPPFRGVTRRIIVIALCAFFGLALLTLFSAELGGTTTNLFVLHGALSLRRLVWEFVTYPFVGGGLLSVAFALLSFWFFGSTLEDERGGRWLSEYFLVATIGGGLGATLVAMATRGHVLGLDAGRVSAAGMWPAVMALVLAFARLHPDQELRLMFLLTLKAKHLAAIYLLFYLALVLVEGDRFGALVVLGNALAGYGFLQLAPRQGFRVGVSEQWFALRNSYIRAKRRRAAKKFTVYMKKQGKDVSLDDEGRYVDPDGKARDLKGRDPNDRRWMN